MGALHQFLDILFKPDNIPIAGMLILVLFFTWVALRQALRNDRLIEQGRADAKPMMPASRMISDMFRVMIALRGQVDEEASLPWTRALSSR